MIKSTANILAGNNKALLFFCQWQYWIKCFGYVCLQIAKSFRVDIFCAVAMYSKCSQFITYCEYLNMVNNAFLNIKICALVFVDKSLCIAFTTIWCVPNQKETNQPIRKTNNRTANLLLSMLKILYVGWNFKSVTIPKVWELLYFPPPGFT